MGTRTRVPIARLAPDAVWGASSCQRACVCLAALLGAGRTGLGGRAAVSCEDEGPGQAVRHFACQKPPIPDGGHLASHRVKPSGYLACQKNGGLTEDRRKRSREHVARAADRKRRCAAITNGNRTIRRRDDRTRAFENHNVTTSFGERACASKSIPLHFCVCDPQEARCFTGMRRQHPSTARSLKHRDIVTKRSEGISVKNRWTRQRKCKPARNISCVGVETEARTYHNRIGVFCTGF